MTLPSRQVYVISDIHLGGAYPTTNDPEDRGFRICTHVAELTKFIDALAAKPAPVELVINGDLIDFLAEQDAETGDSTSFLAEQRLAVQRLEGIFGRDPILLAALGRLLEKGHRLTILLGNHDLELALPLVRKRFAELLHVSPRHDYHFLYDGEAYAIGNMLIEHGNRYDGFNVVDHDGLRRVRSLLSRGQDVPPEYAFAPPAGSRMVAELINPIKKQYRFIDLLKPETDAVLPILLALEPGFRRALTKLAALSLVARQHRVGQAAMPSIGGDISASGPPADALLTVLGGVMDDPSAVLGADTADATNFGEDISTVGETIDRAFGLARLLFARDSSELDRRLPALLAAIRSLQRDASFARDAECNVEYARAALDLSLGGFDYVVFGHTHMARDMWLAGGGRYLNTGSWADMIKFPTEIVSGAPAQALEGVKAFITDLQQGRLSGWTSFTPTYARFDLDETDRVLGAELCDYSATAAI